MSPSNPPAPSDGVLRDRFWLIVHEPGNVPVRKGSWEHRDLPKIMREFIAANPTAYLHVMTLDHLGHPQIDHGPELLQMADGRSMSVGRKHNARTRAAHALANPAGEGGVPHVFLDCDGVLADFDTYAETYFGMPPRVYEAKVGSGQFWSELEAKGDFYRNLPLMADAKALFDGVKHLHPTILTGCPRGNWAQGQKVAWAAEHFPGVPIITCRSADKRDYAKPGDVLIDDWAQHRHRWIKMGGVFITHHDAASSLAALWAHYPALAANGGEAG